MNFISISRSSSPGPEYLEAEYECRSGYYMASNNTRLVCRNRRWLGQLPLCKVRRNEIPGEEKLCTGLGCEHICRIVDGRPRCFCFDGFQSDGEKCIGNYYFTILSN